MTLIQLILAFNPNFATDHPRLFTFIVNHPGLALDRDGDGYTTAVDCDDREASVHPGQQEICDGWDNDCDSLIDSGDDSIVDAQTFYLDADGDGHGSDSATPQFGCDPLPDYADVPQDDCDDLDPASHPGADELLDGVDNDCSGGDLCEFEVVQMNGTIEFMPNVVHMTMSALSPSGQKYVGRQEVLRFNLTVGHPECPGAIWKSGSPDFIWTDNSQTGWVPHDIDLYNLTDDGTSATIWQGDLDVNNQAPVEVDEYIMSGATKTFAIYADSTGASSVNDDTLRVNIDGQTMLWCSENDETVCTHIGDNADGFTLEF